MRSFTLSALFVLLFSFQNVYSQCDYITPPSVKKIKYADREFTFSGVTMNGKATTYLAVKKGEKVKINTYVESRKVGNYCPDCIVQVYWGIRGHASECAKSFHGYQFNKKKSSLKFDAPMEDGIYYITMGSVLDYSCKNNKFRPNCSPDAAFAVLRVGNPDPAKRITFSKMKNGANESLKANLIKAGCFVNLDKIEWFFENQKIAYDNQKEIPLQREGTYKVVYSNCLSSVTNTYVYSKKEVQAFGLGLAQSPESENQEGTQEPTIQEVTQQTNKEDIASRIDNSDKFILESLIFDLGKSDIKPEAEEELDKLAQIMKNKPSLTILLEGHTDRRGSARKNQILSEERVESAKAYLVSQGVNKNNIETKGWGHQKPLIITNDVEEGKINRRVEIQILSR